MPEPGVPHSPKRHRPTMIEGMVARSFDDTISETSRLAKAYLLGERSSVEQRRLDRIAQQASNLLPACAGAELVVCHPVHAPVAASDERIRELARAREAGEQPRQICAVLLSAAGPFRPERLAGLDGWQREMSALGLRTCASIPLAPDEVRETALLLYGRDVDPLEHADAARVQLIADLAAGTIRSLALTEQLGYLMIEGHGHLRLGAAIGVVAERYAVTDEQAFALLAEAGRRLGRKLRDLAEDVLIVDDPADLLGDLP
jgi:hypothetical protein